MNVIISGIAGHARQYIRRQNTEDVGNSIMGIGFVRVLVHRTFRTKSTALNLAVIRKTNKILDDWVF